MRTLLRLSVSLFLSVVTFAQHGPPATLAQTPAAMPFATAAPTTDHRISLDVVVTDKAGRAVSGLAQQNFTLLDDKHSRKFESFTATDGTSRAPDPALQVVFVIDAVNTGAQAVGFGRTQLGKFLRQDAGQLSAPTSLVVFTDKSTQFQPTPTRDGNALADWLNSDQPSLRVLGRSTGLYGAEERRLLSLQALDALAHHEATQPGRKVIIWMSSGWATLSGPNVMMTEKNEKWLFRSIVTLSQDLREARITLYSIDPLGMNNAGGLRAFYYETFLTGVPSYQKAQNGNLALQVLAVQTGGRVLNTGNDLVKEITSCLEDTKAFYTLAFEPPPVERPDEYHDLEVKVDEPGLKARTRTGYYAQPYTTTQQ